ncbi:MAG: metal-dependent hydrolase [Bacteroidetes bacterium]|jgi:inner membrane protein|nr:metal-dependent hydrolase [Bacteroidota bacterium]
MDPVTHGVVGAMSAYPVSSAEHRTRASLVGMGAALLADIETFLHFPSDPLFNLEIHRQFTHSLIFIPAGALIAASLFWLVCRKSLTFGQIYLFSLAGYATHWFMDLITSYGTELLWPFLDTRFSLNIVSVVDPVITLGLLLFTGVALWKNRGSYIGAAWAWLLLFLLLGWYQHHRAQQAAFLLADERGHAVERCVVKPTIGNQLLWRSTYISGDTVYADAVRTGYFTPPKIYAGEKAPVVDISGEFDSFSGSTLYSDLERFNKLSKGYLVRHPEQPAVIGDARYSMLPTSLTPLWGVRADTARPESHLPFLYFRDAGTRVRESFLRMLLGK